MQEMFCQGIAKGMSNDAAYSAAGYKPNRHNASRLKTSEHIIARVMELQGKIADRLVLTKQYLLDAAMENLEKALGRRPVKVTRREKVGEDKYEDVTSEIFVYKGDVANQSLKLLGSELDLFTERKNVTITNEYASLSDAELAQRLVDVGRQMLEGPGLGPVIEHEEAEDDASDG